MGNGTDGVKTVAIEIEARPERHLIRPDGSLRHVECRLRVGKLPEVGRPERMPLSLAVVLDRSGSMHGEKILTAKRAAQAVLDRLEGGDQIAVVVFDDQIDVVQPMTAATPEVKARVRSVLAEIQARASTALHEGWLTGCRAIAGDQAPATDGRLARCFLLTDGLANVGLTDAEQIAGEAAGVRERAGIGTSTFGIGPDYDEGLLGPMAVAGGGQFHHLRNAEDIASTFVGELGELLTVAASQVRLEVEAGRGVTVEAISEYWASPQPQETRWTVLVGDLLPEEERHIVLRLGFPPSVGDDGHTIRLRAAWSAGGSEHQSGWQELRFVYGTQAACDAESSDPAVMHWVGLHHAQRAKREAAELSRRGDLEAACQKVQGVAERIAAYAGSDADLLAAQAELSALQRTLAERPMPAMMAKEVHYQASLASRGQRDHRKKT